MTEDSSSLGERSVEASIQNAPADAGLEFVLVFGHDALHNLGDLFVPPHNEIVYAGRVAERGNSDLLVQRAIRGVGHCDFTPTEFVTAFVDLVSWARFGVKPEGDNWLDPAAVASPDFGCNFTNDPAGDHILATPCP